VAQVELVDQQVLQVHQLLMQVAAAVVLEVEALNQQEAQAAVARVVLQALQQEQQEQLILAVVLVVRDLIQK
jgi:hypothetical protein